MACEAENTDEQEDCPRRHGIPWTGSDGPAEAPGRSRCKRRVKVRLRSVTSGTAAEWMFPGNASLSVGVPPAELYAAGRRELSAYPSVSYRRGAVVEGTVGDEGSRLLLETGEEINALRVLLASGMDYCPPEIDGVDELWGRTVFQCPFCHGWEMRDQRLATLTAGDAGVHSALMLRGWSDDVVLLTNGPSELDADGRQRLQAANVGIDERPIARLAYSSRRHCSSGPGWPKSWAPHANRDPWAPIPSMSTTCTGPALPSFSPRGTSAQSIPTSPVPSRGAHRRP
ncbi:hypothetical protein MycrhN_1357 [Mycolicibacterium rhodesiae NBB3]|uniref:Uncharacterized protein n=1 Tax=Mycolicibacterium rhodesiae (strain NBB3) TaxID=710685 RepID=G8RY85_MYCRN|nr:hypothetical protein MycrhN_1357 [Mycolicibacterium rhodesiae NBB3]